MNTSLFELFKIGIGPSSSHTVGPMRAALRFLREVDARQLIDKVESITVDLYGSLALTGHGHGTDRAVLLGLLGELPDEVDPATVDDKIRSIRQHHRLCLLGAREIPFREEHDLLFHRDQILPGHPNAMRFSAFDASSHQLLTAVYYSVGGGFISREGEPTTARAELTPPPHPFSSAAD